MQTDGGDHRAQTMVQGATEVATGVTQTFRSQPGLLFLTIINIAFLVFCYFVGRLMLEAYQVEQAQIHERYTEALRVVNRCVDTGLKQLGEVIEEEREQQQPPARRNQ